jgi:hypothetical protein
MSKTIQDLHDTQVKKYNTSKNTWEMFPRGTRVKVITPCQDFHFFNEKETGTVESVTNKYLGIIVKFNNPRHFTDGLVQSHFGFNPEDLCVLQQEDENILDNWKGIKVTVCT